MGFSTHFHRIFMKKRFVVSVLKSVQELIISGQLCTAVIVPFQWILTTTGKTQYSGTPLYAHQFITDPFCLSRQKAHIIFSLELTCLIRTPVYMDNRHLFVSQVTNFYKSSALLYRHWLTAHSLFSLSQSCANTQIYVFWEFFKN